MSASLLTPSLEVRIFECRLRLSKPTQQHEAPALRDCFGRQFEDHVLMQSRGPQSDPIFQYPRVQFKVLNAEAVLVGINEGSDLLQQLWLEIDDSKLGSEKLPVLASQFETRTERLEATTDPIQYRFATPWLALNQKNFRSYVDSRNQRFRKDELSRILAGNCLGLAKSLGVRFSKHIEADCRKLISIKTTLRGKSVIGFVGKFSVNLNIPELIGLGKSVAQGFGTVSSC